MVPASISARGTIKWISDLCVCYISQKQKQRINILVKNGIYPTFVIYKYYIEGYGKEKNSKITREEALRRLETARKLKREYVAKLEKEMKEEFKKRTGQEATYFEVW